MTTFIGNDGDVAGTFLTTHGGILNRWTAQFARVISNVTPFGNATVVAHRGGLWGVSGTISGVCDAADDPVLNLTSDADGVALTLRCDGAQTLAFDAIISGGVDVSATGDAELLYDFVQGDTTAITEAWT